MKNKVFLISFYFVFFYYMILVVFLGVKSLKFTAPDLVFFNGVCNLPLKIDSLLLKEDYKECRLSLPSVPVRSFATYSKVNVFSFTFVLFLIKDPSLGSNKECMAEIF